MQRIEMGTFQLMFVLVCASMISTVQLESCNNRCEWTGWSSWSDCDKACAGGQQQRSRKFCCKAELAHDIKQCMQNCGKDYDTIRSGFYDSTGCNEYCYNGGTHTLIPGIGYSYCRCPPRYRGTCCTDIVTCGRPSTISHGSFTGSDFTYAAKIHYSCDINYNMTNPLQSTRTCSASGSWTGSAPTCLYVSSCDSSPCKNGASCKNLLGGYRCVCIFGWTGQACEVDVQPPVFHGCPLNRNIITSNLTSQQNWSEPNFTDPHGARVLVTKNYQQSSFEFPWGEFTIQYSAVKPSNGLEAECKFNISVKPFPCKKMDTPEHGIILCNAWRKEYSQVCIFVCKHNYTLPSGYETDNMYVCGATGNWLPVNSVPLCVSKKIFPTNLARSFSTCTAPTDRKAMSEFYIQFLMKSAMKALCENHTDNCKPANVEIRC